MNCFYKLTLFLRVGMKHCVHIIFSHALVVHCRDLLAAPLDLAQELLQGRVPVPKLLECDQGGSQVSSRYPTG